MGLKPLEVPVLVPFGFLAMTYETTICQCCVFMNFEMSLFEVVLSSVFAADLAEYIRMSTRKMERSQVKYL
jgi:hypothetical protein